jgi:hypothetical protein
LERHGANYLTAHLTPDAWIAIAAALSATFASLLQLWQNHRMPGISLRSVVDEEAIDEGERQYVDRRGVVHVTGLESLYQGEIPNSFCFRYDNSWINSLHS